MVSNAKIKLSGKWKKLEKKLATASPALRRNMRRASMAIGKKGESLIRMEITTGSYAPNAPLTVAIKGGRNEPLKGHRTGSPMFKAITSKVVGDMEVFIGVLQMDNQYNIAVAIHEGTTIGVTPKMRGMFYALWMKEKDPTIDLSERAQELWDQMPGGWMPLKESTKAITIPERPFVQQAWNKGELQKFAKKMWDGAMAATVKELAQ